MIEFEELFEVIQLDKIEDYNFSGVWAMFGIEKKDEKRRYICLNVGKSTDIRAELKADIERLNSFEPVINLEKEYRNQFNEKLFTYPLYASRQDWLYKEISDKYKDFVFILVAKQQENNYTVEKYFAYSTKAVYWVSNGKYASDTIVDDAKIDEIRRNIDVSRIDKEIIDKIDKLTDLLKNQ